MEIYLPIVQVHIDIITILFISFAVGVLSGLFGVGGGFLMTPFLIFLGIPPVYAVPNEINNIVDQKIKVKYLRSYYELKDLGRITMDENIEFFYPSKEFRNPKKINKIILEVKIQRKEIDKNHVEKIINLKESRFSKYCVGINCLRNSN